MFRPLQFALSTCAWRAAVCCAAAQVGPNTEKIAAATPALGLPSPWSFSAEVETYFGYKDNLLLSASEEERSALLKSTVELLLLRLDSGATDFSLFAQADGTRFFSGETVNHETQAWVQSEIGHRLRPALKFSLPLTGYYYDQVFDISDTEVQRTVAELKVHGAMLGPTLRWSLHPRLWLEGQGVVERKLYDDGANDSRIGEGQLRLGWRLTPRVEARISAGKRWRGFDERVQYTTAGRALPGTSLKLVEQEGEVRVDARWDAQQRWRTTTRAGVLRRRDNGPGYFGYDVKRVTQEVTWKNDWWLAHLEGSAERLDFLVQTVGIGISPPQRIKDEFSATLRLERKLSDRWTLLAAYTWERSRSNEQIASYSLNEGLLGVRWSWEK